MININVEQWVDHQHNMGAVDGTNAGLLVAVV
eukprot:CAMPEP_0195273494 /NCGR_PEP_ID=MMETSP0706-20130129/16512_1 /TAXON_ID=33640 /ORGANISM="Asterionellopsis glacialis, Strain CCMP134" /LENGTH=31 /DNA_ID= /DNA_START= /DNA_END= /DNA_ORIENTATION=